VVFKPTFHGLLSLVGGKLFLRAKIAVLARHATSPTCTEGARLLMRIKIALLQ
jgi:hypothetical protein